MKVFPHASANEAHSDRQKRCGAKDLALVSYANKEDLTEVSTAPPNLSITTNLHCKSTVSLMSVHETVGEVTDDRLNNLWRAMRDIKVPNFDHVNCIPILPGNVYVGIFG